MENMISHHPVLEIQLVLETWADYGPSPNQPLYTALKKMFIFYVGLLTLSHQSSGHKMAKKSVYLIFSIVWTSDT